ncbi:MULTISPECIES: hypothetical protein [Aphanizomenonaceae]|uniref:Uncharacterized protein n=1 Tax=Dolichospermum heterosporum TAC447 TaxID=747523 RepID=A0ABY5LZ57_9CYAN|nr:MULTISPECIES: hypothetical protein [Aphanizomenonaceae]UUO16550.1 hypothetical protein NG743_05810 [Dolichospermum heterosporum TAC447]
MKRFLRSASLSHSHIPKNGTSHIPKAIALSYSQNGFPGAIALFNKYD